MTSSSWREDRNEQSLRRLRRRLPSIFPVPVLVHATLQRFIPPTPRQAVDSYWRHHPARADRLARALAARRGTPQAWTWRVFDSEDRRLASSFRQPPVPYREKAFELGPGHCRICGSPVFRFGWHVDLWGDERPNCDATWHASCVSAWTLWTAPHQHVRLLRKLQNGRCPATGKRLLASSQIDHKVPLYRVWREHRNLPWPELLAFWGLPNLQVLNRQAHIAKSASEMVDVRLGGTQRLMGKPMTNRTLYL
jgi:hypothetical protein